MQKMHWNYVTENRKLEPLSNGYETDKSNSSIQ